MREREGAGVFGDPPPGQVSFGTPSGVFGTPLQDVGLGLGFRVRVKTFLDGDLPALPRLRRLSSSAAAMLSLFPLLLAVSLLRRVRRLLSSLLRFLSSLFRLLSTHRLPHFRL